MGRYSRFSTRALSYPAISCHIQPSPQISQIRIHPSSIFLVLAPFLFQSSLNAASPNLNHHGPLSSAAFNHAVPGLTVRHL